MGITEKDRLEIESILDAPSQYPECPRKPREQREADLVTWLENFGEVNACYNLYGQDRADSQPCEDWLDMKAFGKERWEANSAYRPIGNSLKHDHTLIPRSKLLSEMFMAYWFGEESGAYIPTEAIFNHGAFFENAHGSSRSMTPAAFSDFIARHDTGQRLVLKEIFGGRGRQVIIAEIASGKIRVDDELYGPDDFIGKFIPQASTWIIQEYFEQHPGMALFNPSSLNTLRIVTYHVGTHAFVDDAAVRMGHPGALVDNAFAAGYYTTAYEDGTLHDSLFNYMNKTREPNKFKDAVIPNMKAALDLCAECHTLLPELFTIGWDIAIGPDGKPTVVEFNDGWGVFVTQTAWGHAARPAWKRNLAERRAYFDSQQ